MYKTLNIYILITTHSPYFLEAIEMYSKLHGMQEKTNYYLSDIENKYTFEAGNLIESDTFENKEYNKQIVSIVI